MNHWLSLKKPHIEEITYELYSHFISTHFTPYFKPLKLKTPEVSHNHLQEYINLKLIDGKINRCRRKKDKESGANVGLSVETLTKHRMVLRQIFENAILEGIIQTNPVTHIKLPKKQEKKGMFYTVEQANTLLEKLEGEMIKPIVIVALYYGLRRSELMGLKWDAIDFDNNKLYIRHTAVRSLDGNKGKTYYKDSTKSQASCAEFPLIDEVKDVLLQLKSEQSKNKKLFGSEYNKSDYVFTWEDGRLIQPDFVSKKFRKLLKKHDMPDIRFHNLRHTTASILVSKGFDIKSIQMWLRHANVKTTLNIYAHVSEDAKHTIAKDISNMFSSSTENNVH
jgi:integrase